MEGKEARMKQGFYHSGLEPTIMCYPECQDHNITLTVATKFPFLLCLVPFHSQEMCCQFLTRIPKRTPIWPSDKKCYKSFNRIHSAVQKAESSAFFAI